MFLIAILLPLNIRAQIVLSHLGAKNEALASTNSVATGEYSLWRNPAGLTSVDHSIVSTSVLRSTGVPAFTRSVVFATTTRFGSFGSGMSAFGDEIYNEQAASVGFANQLGLASLGIRADIMQLRIEGNSVRRTVGISLGGIAKITSKISLGAGARNINLPRWSDGHDLPVVINAGVLFNISESFLVIAEVEKNTDFHHTLKCAMEYPLRRKFFVRTGFNLFPNNVFAGFGLRAWRLAFDYSARFGYLPGYSHQLGVAYHTNSNNKRSPS